MRIAKWDWTQANKTVAKNSRARAVKAANVLAKEVRRRCPVGTISRPMYRTGPHAGKSWTKLDIGTLKKSVRVVVKKQPGFSGITIADLGGVRVYVGHYFAWYAAIVEFYTPFMRPAVAATRNQITRILENG